MQCIVLYIICYGSETERGRLTVTIDDIVFIVCFYIVQNDD